jgi:putative phosphoribosyl transferase
MFRDREEAGRLLAQRLLHLKSAKPVVLALPRGGVPVGFEVAQALEAPLDLLMVRKIGAPWQPEFALGAVVDGARPELVLNEEVTARLGIDEAWLERAKARELAEIERRRALYFQGRAPVPLEGRTAIVVDDGIATGATVRVALKALARTGAARLVVATPVAPDDTARFLAGQCDEAVFLATPADFGAVGYYYDDFRQVSDEEVVELLERAAAGRSGETQRTRQREGG